MPRRQENSYNIFKPLKMDDSNLWYIICSGLKHAVHPVWPVTFLLTFNQIYKDRQKQVTIFSSVGKQRVKVEQGLRHPKAYLLQVNGVKAISHTPDRDRVLPIVPEGTREREGGQWERKDGGRRQLKKGDKEGEHKPEARQDRWIDG